MSTAAPKASDDSGDEVHEQELREVYVFWSGGKAFGVFAEEVEGARGGLVPTPLPNAAKAIIGVVCVRGRMLTVIDPACAFDGELDGVHVAPAFVVALRGDEQLAIAADSEGKIVKVASAEIVAPVLEPGSGTVLGTFAGEFDELAILNTAELFTAATQSSDRRRQRF